MSLALCTALKNEQTKLVLRLLETDKDLVRVKGREGMTPLHLVTVTGNISLLIDFLEACPDCIEDVTVNGGSALIITATYQSSLSPPGGVWQGSDNGSNNSSISAGTVDFIRVNFTVEPKQAGTTVMDSGKFFMFWLFNTFTLWVTIIITSHGYSQVFLSFLSF